MKIKEVKLSEIKGNDDNPRYITEDKFNKLVQSIKEFPDMLQKRPIVVDENMVALGGNMRLRALQELGIKKVPVIVAEGWTDKQKQEFIIKDNVGFGSWDWDILANEWNTDELISWGMDVPSFMGGDTDLSGFFDTPDEDDESDLDQAEKIVLEYPAEEHQEVKDFLYTLAATPEEAVRILINRYND